MKQPGISDIMNELEQMAESFSKVWDGEIRIELPTAMYFELNDYFQEGAIYSDFSKDNRGNLTSYKFESGLVVQIQSGRGFFPKVKAV